METIRSQKSHMSYDFFPDVTKIFNMISSRYTIVISKPVFTIYVRTFLYNKKHFSYDFSANPYLSRLSEGHMHNLVI